MKKIKILTDTAVDLSHEFIARKPNIDIITFPIIYKDKNIADLDLDKFNEILIHGDEVPHTSQINPDLYMEFFRKYKEYQILYICIGSKLSGTYSSANLAIQMMKEEGENIDITIYDSETISAGEGMFVEQAYEMVKAGKTLSEIVNVLDDIKKHMIFRAIVNDIEYVFKGGRLSKTSCIIGSVLNIKPILSINNNVCIPIHKARGLKKANNFILEELEKFKVKFAYIGTTVDCEMYQSLKNKIKIPFKEFSVGKSVSVHSGPLCYGIMYVTE